MSGTGFVAGDGPSVYACLSGTAVSSASTCTFNSAGVMSASFTVASVPAGSYPVLVTGSTGDTASTLFSVVTHPSITLSPTSGSARATVRVAGSGYAPAELLGAALFHRIDNFQAQLRARSPTLALCQHHLQCSVLHQAHTLSPLLRLMRVIRPAPRSPS